MKKGKMEKEPRLEIGEDLSSQLSAILDGNIFSAREISEITGLSISSVYRWSKIPSARTQQSNYNKLKSFCEEHKLKTLTAAERENHLNLNLFSDSIALTYEEEQEIAAKFNQPMRYENAVSQLQGIAFAVKFDDKVDREEVKMVLTWLKHNQEFIDAWPIADVFKVFKTHCSINREKEELYKELSDSLLLVFKRIHSKDDVVTDIYDEITKEDIFTDKNVVVTGAFEKVQRDYVEEALHELGNRLQSKVSSTTDYVFVGSKGSRSWRFGKHGRKIEDAIYERNNYGKLKIISENDTLKVIDPKAQPRRSGKKERLGIEYAYALDLYFLQEYDSKTKHEAIKNTAEKWGIPYEDLRKWRHLENYNCLVDVAIKNKIKDLCRSYWPSQSPKKLAEIYFPPKELEEFEEEQYRFKEKAKQKNKLHYKLHYKQVALFEKKYNLPELNGKYPRSIRFNRLVDLSKDLSMHLPEIIEKYPQCKEIIFNSSQKYWMDNADQALIELAKIPKEDLKRDEKFDVFTKNDKPQPAGCGTMIIAVTLLLLAII
jgi:transposase